MGIMSEVCSQIESEGYKKILEKALEIGNSEIIRFTKQFIIPNYESACHDGWVKPDQDLINKFNK